MIPHLSPLYVDHLVAPRHAIDLPAPEAAGQKGSMVGGMGVRVTLAWKQGRGGEARVRDAGIRVFGSTAAIAPASWCAEAIVGRTAEEAGAIDADSVVRTLEVDGRDALPAAVARGALFVIDALRCALGLPYYRPADPQGPGVLVCRCLGVGDRQIRDAISRGAVTPERIGADCGAGLGCGSCRPDLLVLLGQELSAPTEPPPADRHPVARIALARVGPLLAAHGCPLRDADVTGEVVRLRLGEPLEGALLTPRSAEALARHCLRETVSEAIRVEAAAPP